MQPDAIPTPTEAEVAGIVARLTKPQREVVMRGYGDRANAAEVFAVEPSLFTVWNATGETAWLTSSTPLGHAVRAKLQKEQDDAR